ncbi:cardiolipin synthase B [Aggregicoccus sp. 17bor-14]|uniref:phospholipase D-like domain-containing protein n=1 Tax=Myxococcaceae TaxID=31 RepID=UPI00129CA0D8|nr:MULTISPECIES: phospholipase D-like domain-containing protein [Myxococcaceae]MBF5042897.1 cardiolipin synthase B [Simulacricoccus sp. 17bor-14]MRI88664.1 cardiolipin synthase B [Aggregicoccus sp. 17bor-14]
MQRVALGAGFVVGGALGVAARRFFHRRLRFGPWGPLGEPLPGGVDAVGLALMQATSTEMLDGNRLTLRDNGEVFPALERAFLAARRSIHVDVYIWKPGPPGDRLRELACQRAREGVAVRILVDPVGSPGFAEHLAPALREAGCEVHYFRPFEQRPFAFTGRNHRKIVIVDGRVGFTGGFGISPEWDGDGLSPCGWRDSNVEVEGPVVRQMQVAFASHWLETGGRMLAAEDFTQAQPAGDARAAYVTSTDVQGLSHARWVTHIALAAARERAWIANAYFIPPPGVLGTLCARAARGVELRLMLPGPYQDHPTVTFLQRRLYPRLERSGVRVYEYQPSMLHAKTMLVDDRLVVVGSINLDYLSMEYLEEGSLVVDDRAFAAEFARRWEVDLSRSKQRTWPREARVPEVTVPELLPERAGYAGELNPSP